LVESFRPARSAPSDPARCSALQDEIRREGKRAAAIFQNSTWWRSPPHASLAPTTV